MDVDVKKAAGSIIKSLTYQAIITRTSVKDAESFNQCVAWRELHEESTRNYEAYQRSSNR